MLNRRDLILTGASAAALVPLAAAAENSEDAKLATLFDAFFQQDLRRRPEGATQLGLDTGANGDLRSKLSDGSAAGLAAAKAQNAEQLRRLAAIDRGASPPPARSTTTPCSTRADRRPPCRRSTSADRASAPRPMWSAS